LPIASLCEQAPGKVVDPRRLADTALADEEDRGRRRSIEQLRNSRI
jgi:hypothetical protein